ncbi:MAG: S-adenosylmethionine decarboxylase [Selenomonadaceae bacterium]|nr:S-adenosylmethionine decarboxylase [Selenomonadaceae bacterium]MBR3723125.1 S-adenosylmethionine decarboxylase [Selenomonadaceae bacterium]
MKLLSRHLMIDFYHCKEESVSDGAAIERHLRDTLTSLGYEIEATSARVFDDQFAVTVIFPEGHLAIHAYRELHYVALDVFLCKEDAEPESIYRPLKNFFAPDKTKTTLIKRGDFTKEIKPKTKTRFAPVRKLKITGANVIRILSNQK